MGRGGVEGFIHGMEFDLASEEQVFDQGQKMTGTTSQAVEFPDDDMTNASRFTPSDKFLESRTRWRS